MSFSKAKIQRFNELPNEAPPPGTYDPKIDSKGKGVIIEKKSLRFNDNQSVASSGNDCTRSVSSSRGIAPLISPKFRTPQLLKKRLAKLVPTSCPKAKTKLILTPKEFKYDTKHELADLKVECENKDKTIRDHEKCIDDLKNEVKKLEESLQDAQKKQNNVEEQYKKDFESMANLQQDILNARDEKHMFEVTSLRTQLLEILESRENDDAIRQKIEEELKLRISELSAKAETLEFALNTERTKSREFNDLLQKYQKLEMEMNERERNFIEEFNDVEMKKQIVFSELTDTIIEQERKLIENRDEIDQLQMTTDGLTKDLKKSGSSNEFLQSAYEKVQKEIKSLMNSQAVLQETLESREQVVVDLQGQLSTFQNDMKGVKSEKETLLLESQQKQCEIAEIKRNFLCEKQQMEVERDASFLKQREIEKKNQEFLMKNNALINEIGEIQKKYEELKSSFREIENELDNEREFSEILESNHQEEMRKLKKQIEEIKCPRKSDKKLKKSTKNSPPKAADVESLEEKLLERDRQIEELTETLEDLKITSETQVSFSQSLQEELDRSEAELATKKKELKDLKEQIREETAEMVARRRRFDVVMAENQATVAALAQRLAESNEELERVQYELKSSDELINEQRDLINNMRNSSQIVNDQMLSLIEQLDVKHLDDLERKNLQEIQTLKSIFESKINEIKNLSQNEIKKLRDESKKKQVRNGELEKEIKDLSEKVNLIQNMLLSLEEQNDTLYIEISELQLSKAKLQQELREQSQVSEEMKTSLETEVEKYKQNATRTEERAEELSIKLNNMKKDQLKLEQLQKKFDEQKQILKDEMMFRKCAEEEAKKLVESCERLKKNYQDITEKYSEVIGHQNHKQRLKQLNQLKEKIETLEKELDEKRNTIDQQNKTIERFQADERRRTFTKGKENFGAFPKSPFGTPVSSPHKSLTPLRERNE